MSLSQRLDLRQSQQLVMTPQLQQAIKLLQMSSQELGAYVEDELEKNPLLERADDSFAEHSASTQAEQEITGNASEAPPSPDAEEPSDNWGEEADRFALENHSGGAYHDDDDDEADAAHRVADAPSLREHLLAQIHMDFSDPIERMIATALLDLLDEAGYLPSDLEPARAQLGADPALFEGVISKLQRLDPSGVFARSLKECLQIQLRERNRLDPAMQALLDNLPLVAARDRPALRRVCGVGDEDLAQMFVEIKSLCPKPASAFTADVAPTLIPDVVLLPRHGGGWHVELNTDTLPRVLVNARYYAEIQKAAKSKAEDKTYLSDRWQQANWLVKALHQRATTILKVATEIVRQQDAFFTHGVQFLKPLVLRDIAAAIEMHESTVSRVTQSKYILTPRGIFEMKYFFSTKLGTTGGVENVSSEAVRTRIKELVSGEAPDAILSDDKLADLLRREGIAVARRTVAKYRENLGIPSSADRRRAARL